MTGRRTGRAVLTTVVLVLLPTIAAAEDRHLDVEMLFSPDDAVRKSFDGATRQLTWLDDGSLGERRSGSQGKGLWLLEGKDLEAVPLFEPRAIEKALVAVPGLGPKRAAEMVAGPMTLAPNRSAVLFEHSNDLFVWRRGSERAVRLTTDKAVEHEAAWSPDGRLVSFVRHNDLWLADPETARSWQVTEGGGPELFHGRLDWVYQEEVYGRGNFRGYWWSPDGSQLVFIQLDESPVREFTVVDHLPTELDLEVTNYPKAGSPNPTVRLAVVDATGGEPRWIDTSEYLPIEHLIVRVGWTPESDRIVVQVQDREQRWLDLLLADPETGEVERLFREQSPAFVNVTGEPEWLADGSFLWLSERTGFQHLYHYSRKGRLLEQLTDGEWEVETLHGVDEEAGVAYINTTEAGPTGSQLWSIALADGARRRISKRPGHHRVRFAPNMKRYLDTWSDVSTPWQLRLHSADGSVLAELDTEGPATLADFDWGSIEFLQVPTRDGFVMEASLIKPPNFDAKKKYPVLQYNYGGPHAPVVENRWGGDRYLWHQMLAQRGYVIWMCDNRSASGKGIAPTWKAYRQLGVIELQDIEDGIAWLRKQPWVDSERIGIWGWSYGGFMASYALTHSKSFKAGIAGAPVTDWGLYDTIYTERYMARPQNNKEGYAGTSVAAAAANLHGDLLILHGLMDDNVHFQNTVQLVYALQKAGKDFDLMVYPRSRHGVRDPNLVYDLYRRMTEFIEERL